MSSDKGLCDVAHSANNILDTYIPKLLIRETATTDQRARGLILPEN